jgi:hypothetical protein
MSDPGTAPTRADTAEPATIGIRSERPAEGVARMSSMGVDPAGVEIVRDLSKRPT